MRCRLQRAAGLAGLVAATAGIAGAARAADAHAAACALAAQIIMDWTSRENDGRPWVVVDGGTLGQEPSTDQLLRGWNHVRPSGDLAKAFRARPAGGAVSGCPGLPHQIDRPQVSFGAEAAEKAMHKNGEWMAQFTADILAISLPVISGDGDYALVSVGVTCGGLCGNGSVVLYRRDHDGRWNPVGDGGGWIS